MEHADVEGALKDWFRPAEAGPSETLSRSLRTLYEAAGKPTYRSIVMQAQREAPTVYLSPSSISDWMRGRTPRSWDSAAFLITYLTRRLHRIDPSFPTPSIEQWHRIWAAAARAKLPSPPATAGRRGTRARVPLRQPRMTMATRAVLHVMTEDPDRSWYGHQITELTGLPSGTVYPILTRLEVHGWAVSAWEDIDPHVEGRPRRRHYWMTDAGIEHVRTLAAKRLRTGLKEWSEDPGQSTDEARAE